MPRVLFALVLSVLLSAAASAQPTPFDPASLDALFAQAPRVEVNLSGAMLQLAAGSDDDPDTADMLGGLRSITVRVYDVGTALDGFVELDERLSAFADQFASDGWQTLVRVRPTDDDPESVWIYVRGSDDPNEPFDGMAVMAVDGTDGEASFVFLDGPIDLDDVGELGNRFGGLGASSDAEMDTAQAEADAEMAEFEAEQAAEEADRATPND